MCKFGKLVETVSRIGRKLQAGRFPIWGLKAKIFDLIFQMA